MRPRAAVASYRIAALSLTSWSMYLLWAAATVIGLLSLYLFALVGLARTQLLPPPPIINNLCADAKLQFLRDHLTDSPSLIVVGSSVAWRDIDGQRLLGDGRLPLNAGFCAAQANQAAFVTRFLMDHLRSVRTVIAVFAPQDFRACSKTRARLFDVNDASAYIFHRTWIYGLYLRYFDPVSLVRNVHRLSLRLPDLAMDRFGDAMLRSSGSRPVIYKGFGAYDESCFGALHDMALSVSARGGELLVATAPVNSEWITRFDPKDRVVPEFSTRIAKALKGTRAVFWDGAKAFPTTPADFTDNALHLRRSVAIHYTTALAQVLDENKVHP
jgi:hypothetical protein